MFELIPSKDMRKYLGEQGREFSDFEKATLTYNSRGHKKSEIEQALQELAQSTKDEKLMRQINKKFKDDKRRLEAFINRRDGYAYHLTGVQDIRCLIQATARWKTKKQKPTLALK